MKKRFKLILFFLILNSFLVNANALDSRCEGLFKSIKENKLNLIFDELDYKKITDFNFEFDSFYNLKTAEWEYKRDEFNNLIISKINDREEISEIVDDLKYSKEITIGDKLISINGTKVSSLSDIQIDKLLEDYTDFKLTEQQLSNLKFEFEISNGEKIVRKASYLDREGQAEASVYVKVKNISDIDVKNNKFTGDLTVSVSWQIENLYPLSKEYLIVDKSKDEYWYCMFSPKEFEEMQIGEVFFENINSIQQNENLIEDKYNFFISDYFYSSEIYDKEDREFVEIIHDKKGNFTFSNEYNLKAFPFDRQILRIKIADPSRDFEWLRLNVDNWTVIGLQDFKSKGEILEWKIIDTYANYFNEVDPVSTNISSGVELVFEIERNYQYYLF